MKEVIKVLKSNDFVLRNDKKTLYKNRCLVSVVLCITATLMLIQNLAYGSMTLAYLSIILLVGFLTSAIFAGVFKMEKVSATIIAGLAAVILSAFALTGGNEGFAVLWILLVPLFSINILGVLPGVLVSTYFLIFLFVLFDTPAKSIIEGKYTTSFISRFFVLYMSDYLIATFFSLQREYYHRKLRIQVYTDGLTGAYNRRFFMESLKDLEKKKKAYGIISIDLNGLKRVNDSLGHEAGDEIIKGVVECCEKTFEEKDIICRLGGDEFSVISFENEETIKMRIGELNAYSKKWKGRLVDSISFATGYAYQAAESEKTYSEIMKIADQKMYQNKKEYYQDKNHNRRYGEREGGRHGR